jgi:raffinose/stachyose/melibiose transport system permease protein
VAVRSRAKASAPSRAWSFDRVQEYLIFVLFSLLSIIALYPIVWLITNSLKTSADMFDKTWALPKVWYWDNYVKAWNFGIQNGVVAKIESCEWVG